MTGGLPRSVGVCFLLALPALVCRFVGVDVAALPALAVYGTAVVAASFLLAWVAEAAEVDISGGLAIAVLAFIAVLPEYAVEIYFAYTAGRHPDYIGYAAANMTGSNRLLLGLGWSVVVLIALWVAARRGGKPVRELVFDSGYRMELGFLAIASVLALLIPITEQIHLLLGIALLGLFVCYLWRVSRVPTGEPELIGPAAAIGTLPAKWRRPLVLGLFVLAAVVILAAAEPFAHALIGTGTQLGVDGFLLVQWLAPLASETPEFIVAILFATRGRAANAIGMLISSKVNQWTLLVGSLPLIYLVGGGSASLHLDGRQVEEFLLTAAQALLGVAALLAMRFPRWAAWTLLALFVSQFAIPGQQARHVLCGVYAALTIIALVRNRGHILSTLATPFRTRTEQAEQVESVPQRGTAAVR